MDLSVILTASPNKADNIANILSRLSLSNILFTKSTNNNLKWEIIIVDCGSDDHTLDVVRTFYEYMPVKYIYIPIHSIFASSYLFNVGLKCAEGKLVCHLDANSWISENLLLGAVNPFIEITEDKFEVRNKDIINQSYDVSSTESTLYETISVDWLEKFSSYMLDPERANAKISSVFEQVKIPSNNNTNNISGFRNWCLPKKYVVEIGGMNEAVRYGEEHRDFINKCLECGLQKFTNSKYFCSVNLWSSDMIDREQEEEVIKLLKKNEYKGQLINDSYSIIEDKVRTVEQHEEYINELQS